MIHFLYILILTLLLHFACGSSNDDPNKNKQKGYLVKISYIDKRILGDGGDAYVYFPKLDFNNFKIVDSIEHPKLFYHFILNGGMYVTMDFSEVSTLACCEFNDLNKGTIAYFGGGVSDSVIQKYHTLTDSLSENIFDQSLASSYEKSNDSKTYEVLIWEVSIDYCVCPIYDYNIPQPAEIDSVLSIKTVKDFKAPHKNVKDEFVKVIDKVVGFDF